MHLFFIHCLKQSTQVIMKDKILFITQDLAVGGGTSSLSALYTAIKDRYEISVFLLASEGNATVAYKDVLVKSKLFTDLYYRNLVNSRGLDRCVSFFVKAVCKILNATGVNIDRLHVKLNKEKLKGYKAVISFGEGVATLFTQYIDMHPRTAWIHYEVSKYPYRQSFFNLYKQFDHIVTVSNKIADGLKSVYPELAPRILGIHNIIDVERISILSQANISETFSNNEFNIISLGRLSSVKRFPRIPEIARLIADKGYNIKWRIYGPECEQKELVDLNDNITKYNVGSIVEYGGNRTNPYPYLKNSDLFVILSTSEACPMVITEARVLNVPIIATDFATASEFVEDGVDGVVCQIAKIADNIIDIMNDKSKVHTWLENSKKRSQNNELAIQQMNRLIV